jgi:hypothetical protein
MVISDYIHLAFTVYIDIIKLLIDNNADVIIKTSNSVTVLLLLFTGEYGHIDI